MVGNDGCNEKNGHTGPYEDKIVQIIPRHAPHCSNAGRMADRLIKLILSAFDYPELPPPIRRSRGGLRRLCSKRRVQQVADSPNP